MWTEPCIVLLRAMVGDMIQPYTYSDDSLQSVLAAAAQLNLTEIGFKTDYFVDVVDEVIDPDPVDAEDNDFVNLMTIKAACIIEANQARIAAKRGVVMRDNTKSIDLSKVADAIIQIWKNGWCKNYEQAKFDYFLYGSYAIGAAIVGPFRAYVNWPAGPWSPDGDYTGYSGGTGLGVDGRYR
jgi:hypothetical protein